MATSRTQILLAVTTMLLAACGPSSPASCDSGVVAPGCDLQHPILSVVTPDTAAISVGATILLKDSVTYNPTNLPYTLSWGSLNGATASVDSTGLVTGRAATIGVAICATVSFSGGSSQSCATVTVLPAASNSRGRPETSSHAPG